MRLFLKYLLPVIVAAFFWNCTDNRVSEVSDDVFAAVELCEITHDTGISASDSEFSVPRQVSFASSQTVQRSARNGNGSHRRNIEFAKSGKVINAGVLYFIQRNTIIVKSSRIEPSNRLLCLGRLII